ncbi:hypothetical protein EG329_004674 [Mollisiaceae sp. DMI_Dod_QoI]|nr:hypothetical protein EG329_004674 [Helotiales sp. DMI_Dod_QoI]
MDPTPHIAWPSNRRWEQSFIPTPGGDNLPLDNLSFPSNSIDGVDIFGSQDVSNAQIGRSIDAGPSKMLASQNYDWATSMSLRNPMESNPIAFPTFSSAISEIPSSTGTFVESASNYTHNRAPTLSAPTSIIKHRSGQRHPATSRTHFRGQNKPRKPPIHTLIGDKCIRKRKASSDRLRLIRALGLLEPLKSTLEPYRHFQGLINQLEESITKEMMSDTQRNRLKTATNQNDNNSAHHQIPILSSREGYKTESSASSVDFSSRDQSLSSMTSATEDQSIDEQDLMDLVMDIDTPRAMRPLDITYRCIFQKPGQQCDFSSKRESDWARHGESDKHFPQKRYMCILCIDSLDDDQGSPLCIFCFSSISINGNNKQHYLQCEGSQKGRHIFSGARDENFKRHLRKHSLTGIGPEQSTWTFDPRCDWPRECGFCGDQFSLWGKRTSHIAEHFRQGADISQWRLPFEKTRQPRDNKPSYYRQDEDDDDDDEDGDDNNHYPRGGGRTPVSLMTLPSSYSRTSLLDAFGDISGEGWSNMSSNFLQIDDSIVEIEKYLNALFSTNGHLHTAFSNASIYNKAKIFESDFPRDNPTELIDNEASSTTINWTAFGKMQQKLSLQRMWMTQVADGRNGSLIILTEISAPHALHAYISFLFQKNLRQIEAASDPRRILKVAKDILLSAFIGGLRTWTPKQWLVPIDSDLKTIDMLSILATLSKDNRAPPLALLRSKFGFPFLRVQGPISRSPLTLTAPMRNGGSDSIGNQLSNAAITTCIQTEIQERLVVPKCGVSDEKDASNDDTDVLVPVVLVMGISGSRKSDFVRLAVGSADPVKNHKFLDLPQSAQLYKCLIGTRHIFLLDTPSFDGTFQEHKQIWIDTAKILSSIYRSHLTLSGIVYLHPISKGRMTMTTMGDLSILQKMCGTPGFKNVILMTTDWPDLPRTSGSTQREDELLTKELWTDMVSEGCGVRAFMNTQKSAESIIMELTVLPPVILQIQREIVDLGLHVNKTTAGKALQEGLKQRPAKPRSKRFEKSVTSIMGMTETLEDKKDPVEHVKDKQNTTKEFLSKPANPESYSPEFSNPSPRSEKLAPIAASSKSGRSYGGYGGSHKKGDGVGVSYHYEVFWSCCECGFKGAGPQAEWNRICPYGHQRCDCCTWEQFKMPNHH